MSNTVRAALAAMFMCGATAYAAAPAMRLTSNEIAEGRTVAAEQVYNEFDCTGGNVSPQLRWTNAPAATKSFALTVFDPDAPEGGWWHWIVLDIPAAVTELPKGWGRVGAVSPGNGARQMRTDFETPGYGGPCPPPGDPHRYVFSVYALDIAKLPLPDDATTATVDAAIGAHTLSKAVVTARYGR